MVQAAPILTTFDEFIAWYPENSKHRYELHDGIIVEMPKPTGSHTKVASFIRSKIDREMITWRWVVASTLALLNNLPFRFTI